MNRKSTKTRRSASPSARTPCGTGGTSKTPTSRADIQKVLIPEERIAARVRQLAGRIDRDFQGRELVVVGLLTGTVVFIADLIRALSLPLQLDFIGVSSYGSATRPGELRFTQPLRQEIRGRDVLVVDDILDTGRTLSVVLQKLRRQKPCRLRTCVLLNKPSRRAVRVRGDYVGFRIPNHFVVGYGLDFAGRYRNLPFVGILKRGITP